VAIDEAVCRRSVGDGNVGTTAGTSLTEFLDSHEKGPVSFLGGAGIWAAFEVAAEAAGGDHGADGSDPWKPWSTFAIGDRAGIAGFESSSTVQISGSLINSWYGISHYIPFSVLGNALGSTWPSKLTLSKLVVERRCDVSSGDFGWLDWA
jgi:hypothetical protein